MHKVTTSPSFSLAACFTASILAYNTWETVTVIFLSPRLLFSTLFMRVFLRRTPVSRNKKGRSVAKNVPRPFIIQAVTRRCRQLSASLGNLPNGFLDTKFRR